jgi:ribonuclease-3
VARSLLETVVALFEPGALDYKSRLQEREQGAAHGSPRYELLASEGPEHARTFRVVVRDTTGRALAEGEGRSKLEAEQSAARAALGEPERVAMDAGSEA